MIWMKIIDSGASPEGTGSSRGVYYLIDWGATRLRELVVVEGGGVTFPVDTRLVD